jgi:hypothetical protein
VSGAESDWVTQVLDTVESTVAKVRSATTDRVLVAVRIALFAFMALGVLMVLMLVTVIGLVRLTVNLLPARNDVWAAYTIVGAVLVLAGLLAWRKRLPSR